MLPKRRRLPIEQQRSSRLLIAFSLDHGCDDFLTFGPREARRHFCDRKPIAFNREVIKFRRSLGLTLQPTARNQLIEYVSSLLSKISRGKLKVDKRCFARIAEVLLQKIMHPFNLESANRVLQID